MDVFSKPTEQHSQCVCSVSVDPECDEREEKRTHHSKLIIGGWEE